MAQLFATGSETWKHQSPREAFDSSTTFPMGQQVFHFAFNFIWNSINMLLWFFHERWSKIAQQLPGRTDNEIKNYWRARVQKQAKRLKCDVHSKRFREAMRSVWIPRLIERICASSDSPSVQPSTATCMNSINSTGEISHADATIGTVQVDSSVLPRLSITSSDSHDARVSSVSDLPDCYNPLSVSNHPNSIENGSGLCSENLAGTWNIIDWVGFKETDDGDSLATVECGEHLVLKRTSL